MGPGPTAADCRGVNLRLDVVVVAILTMLASLVFADRQQPARYRLSEATKARLMQLALQHEHTTGRIIDDGTQQQLLLCVAG
jgi:hypothetical protein